jgi:plasmid stability protein
MSQVLVRDVDPAVLEKLKARAKNNHRSLEAELRLVLAKAAAAEAEPTGVQAEVERVRALFAGRRFGDSAELVREDRDR